MAFIRVHRLSEVRGLSEWCRHRLFALQNLIEICAFETMAPRKGTLISLPLNGGRQQLDSFVIIKCERLTA